MSQGFQRLCLICLLIACGCLATAGAAMADDCVLVAPHCRQCVQNGSGNCCHTFPSGCGCVYDQCLLAFSGDGEQDLSTQIFSPVSPVALHASDAPATSAAAKARVASAATASESSKS